MVASSIRFNLVRGAKGIHIQLVVQHIGESPAAFTCCNAAGLNFAHSPSTSTSSVLRILLSTGEHVDNANPRQFDLCSDLSGSRAFGNACSSRFSSDVCIFMSALVPTAATASISTPSCSWRRQHLPPSVD